MATPRIRDPARRAEAERYLRSSGARLRFWFSCALFFPIANVAVLVLVAAATRDGHDLDAVAVVATIALLAAVESLVLHRWTRAFAPRSSGRWLIGGALLAATITFVGIWIVIFGLLVTHGDPS